MKNFFKEFRTALDEIAITFLFFIPCTCKMKRKLQKQFQKNKPKTVSLFWHGSFYALLSSSLNLSAIIAINSLFVGFPLAAEIV